MRGRLRFLRQGRFWLNYLFILAVTSWLPLLTQTATMTDSGGKVLTTSVLKVPVWQSWRILAVKGPAGGHGQAVAMHLGLCFVITAFVWFLMSKPLLRDLPDPKHEDNAPSSGDAPVPQASRLPESDDENTPSSGDAPHE